jgi:hypothetical protein
MHLKVIPFSSALYLALYVTWKRHKIQLLRYLFIRVGHLTRRTVRDNLSLIGFNIKVCVSYIPLMIGHMEKYGVFILSRCEYACKSEPA